MDFSRFELLEFCGTKAEPHPGWALNRHGVYNSHIPECFSFVHFSGSRAGQRPVLAGEKRVLSRKNSHKN
jgi:hypothetical protein